MNSLQKFKLSEIIGMFFAWQATLILFFQAFSLDTEFILFGLGVYSVAIAIFEVPAGLVGDKFSHKVSVMLGRSIIALAPIIFVLGVNNTTFLSVMIVFALGQALMSGSNTAILHKLSDNFKQDNGNLSGVLKIVAAIVLIVGVWLFDVNLFLPFIVTSVFLLVSVLLLSSIKIPDRKIDKKMSSKLNKTVVVKVLGLMLLSASVLAYGFVQKWVYTPVYQEMGIDVKWWGILFAIPLVGASIGRFTSAKFDFNIYLVAILAGITIFFSNIYLFGVAVFFILRIFIGYVAAETTTFINGSIADNYRATINSFTSLISRGIYTLYMWGFAVVIGFSSLNTWFLVSGIFLILISVAAYFISKKQLTT